ncbi:unnamed protein product [Lactuca virosa]|uniref:Uncharacterized protein n=1 Tax=Lactuca virosa TaxID=75947 RepID=A0AAU9NQ12_9ASTR|nr:unnamed protein product [Lactuca virosa]
MAVVVILPVGVRPPQWKMKSHHVACSFAVGTLPPLLPPVTSCTQPGSSPICSAHFCRRRATVPPIAADRSCCPPPCVTAVARREGFPMFIIFLIHSINVVFGQLGLRMKGMLASIHGEYKLKLMVYTRWL